MELSSLVWYMVRYALSPHILVAHSVAGGLLYSLVKQSANRRQILTIALLQAVAIYGLWLVLGTGLGTILSLYACLYLYEDAVGTKLDVYDNISITSDFAETESIRRVADKLNCESVKNERGHLNIRTKLRLAQRCQTKRVETTTPDSPANDIVLSLEDVLTVESGCDNRLRRSLRRLDIQPKLCISLHLAGENKVPVLLIAETVDYCNQWLEALNLMIGKVPDGIDVGKEWLKSLAEPGWTEKGNSLISLGVDEAVHVLKKAKRNVDNNYIADLFKTLSKNASNDKSRGKHFKLNFDQFSFIIRYAAITPEIELIFNRLQETRIRHQSLRPNKFHDFVATKQKERYTIEDFQKLIQKHEPILEFSNLSVAGFANYLMDESNFLLNPKHKTIYQDMRQPLSHYFIATSHNTYLTKDQLKSKSSVDAYINAFKRGCKCVELDCWDGPNNEPIIFHGHTLTSKILFKDVIQGIKDYAFCVSQYPVILSFENHCSIEQQKVMATHLKKILGDKLYTNPLPEGQTCLASPEELSGYVIVKAKKLKEGVDETEDVDDDFSDDEDLTEEAISKFYAEKKPEDDGISMTSFEMDPEEDVASNPEKGKENKLSMFKNVMQSMESISFGKSNKDKPKVPKIAQELSDLVFYCQAVSFKSFDYSAANSKHYEMSSFGEKKAVRFAKDECKALLQYNQRQLSRIYPAGVRIDSSNYDPVPMWNCGCQLVALNYQTPCREMQLNQGLFQDNGGCGYVLKPDFMRQDYITFDPFATSGSCDTLSIRIISGHQVPYKTDRAMKSERSLQVLIRIAGVEADCQQQRTKFVKNNGYNPNWEEVMTFKLHVPQLALVHFSIFGKEALAATYALPYHSIKPGYRRVPLWNKHCEPLPNSYLLVHVDVIGTQ